MISNSGKDENRKYHGGKAGDQGGEWNIINWYNRPWNCVLRHPDAKVRKKLAELSRKAALNDKVGYDQYERNTYWTQLQKAGYDPSKITVACEADCSAGVIANTKAVGHLLGISALKNLNATYTGNMRSGFKAAGFEVLTASKYLTSDAYLLEGDILLNDNAHTAVNLDNGSKASVQTTTTTKKTVEEVAKEVLAGKWGNGDARKAAVEKAGYNYDEVQAKVNQLAKGTSAKKSVTEIAKEVINGEWGNGAERKRRLIQAGYDFVEVQNKVNALLK